MRTERVASGNFKNDVRCRLLLETALAHAVSNIEYDAVYWTNQYYPDWDLIVSQYTGDRAPPPSEPLQQGVSWDFVPRGAILSPNALPVPGWVQIPVRGGEWNWAAYAVINTSGLLDANYAGGAASRDWGVSPDEIRIDQLAEIKSVPKFVEPRSTKTYYESEQDLLMRGTNGTPSALSQPPINFVTYSAYPQWDKVCVGGSVADLTKAATKQMIINAFTNSGFDGVQGPLQAATAYSNLVDYVDDDNIPGNLGGTVPANPDGPYVEPVWMVNEVVLSNRLMFYPVNGTNYVKGDFKTQLECVFPFKNADPTGYKLKWSILFATNAASPYTHFLPVPNPVVDTRPINAASGEYFTWTTPLGIPIASNGSPFLLPVPATVTLEADASVWVLNTNNVIVDQVVNKPIHLQLVIGSLAADSQWHGTQIDSPAHINYGKQCIDPRRNWDGSAADQWLNYASGLLPTIGTTNSVTAREFTGLNQFRIDGDLAMFVANHQLRSAGELGYLFFGKNLETVRLYNHVNNSGMVMGPYHSVLDHFTVTTNVVAKGRVNINTRVTNVLASVFWDMPLDRPSAAPPGNPISDALAGAVVSMIMGGGPYANLSCLGSNNWKALAPGGTELEREGFIRNSVNLLDVRQNLFTILLRADVTRDIPTQVELQPGVFAKTTTVSVLSGQRAVAEIWRDPMPTNDPSGYSYHPCFVRFYKIMKE
jgi:hypothetical protein